MDLNGSGVTDNPPATPTPEDVKPGQSAVPSGAVAATPVDAQDILDIVGPIRDPELPFSLQDLDVVALDRIQVRTQASHGGDPPEGTILLTIKPTVPHCSFVSLIALCLRSRLQRLLPEGIRWKVDLALAPGSHNTPATVTRQINDKERVQAALETPEVRREVLRCTDDEACGY